MAGVVVINYDGPRVLFAIKQHPRQALDDIRHMIAGIATLTDERRVLQQRVMDLENEVALLRARNRD